ncbi:hypothetical protein DFP72DRAFT_881242 [Ephemerocybe angulata]|uniref:Ubiquitin-like domain-containing protein n=1 Tax=Ephemerocybe angulata TaxID=980116 RepID=A0A8H6IA81_9AGAR|nr:hypothetical protein DFP72DRAFT_881242 [Tulosesus angulatus]
MSEYDLESRAGIHELIHMIEVEANFAGKKITLKVNPAMTLWAFKEALKEEAIKQKAPGIEPHLCAAKLGGRKLNDLLSLSENGVADEKKVNKVDFVEVKTITVNAWVNVKNGCKKEKVKVDPDMVLPAFRAAVGKLLPGFDLNAYEPRLVLGPKTGPEGKLDEFKTLRGNAVVEGSTISFQPMFEFPVSIVGREGTVVMKAATDLKVSAFKKLVEGKLGIDLGKYQARGADGKILSTLSTLRAAGVGNGTKVQYTPAV